MGNIPGQVPPVWESSHQPSLPTTANTTQLCLSSLTLGEAANWPGNDWPVLAPHRCDPASPGCVVGSENCHLIVNFDAKNSNFPSVAFYFPTVARPAPGRVTRAVCSTPLGY